MPATPSDHGRVVGDRVHLLARVPDMPLRSVGTVCCLHEAAKPDLVACVRPLELPWIAERQPFLRVFELAAIADYLAEQAIRIADAIAVGGDAERRHALHEAGREPPEAAVPQRGIRLSRAQPVEIDAELGKGEPGLIHQSEVGERVFQQAPYQELERQVVDALAVVGIVGAGRRHPPLDNVVACCKRCRDKPVPFGRDNGIRTDRIGQLGDDRAAQRRHVLVLGRQGDPPRRTAGNDGRAHRGLTFEKNPCLANGKSRRPP